MAQIRRDLLVGGEGCVTVTCARPEDVATSSELPVKNWTFPRTPEIGGAGGVWARPMLGNTCAPSKEMTARCSSGCFWKRPALRVLSQHCFKFHVSSPFQIRPDTGGG